MDSGESFFNSNIKPNVFLKTVYKPNGATPNRLHLGISLSLKDLTLLQTGT
jgi:hypothetical protein